MTLNLIVVESPFLRVTLESPVRIAEEEEEERAMSPAVRRTTRASSRQRKSPVDPSSEPVYNTLPRRSTHQHK
ncbi:hypothetical protein Tcan_15205 [Toxocara canis]|uniref:Uncharacterized protein n=1 Tax=Toxocara canis TaxID=6265 RepID=A0A0B2W5T1_TOXCA|nr:hypothetical protein Tcan_15205 [Toxocara canis]